MSSVVFSQVMDARDRRAAAAAHEARAGRHADPFAQRRARHEVHPVEDFLFHLLHASSPASLSAGTPAPASSCWMRPSYASWLLMTCHRAGSPLDAGCTPAGCAPPGGCRLRRHRGRHRLRGAPRHRPRLHPRDPATRPQRRASSAASACTSGRWRTSRWRTISAMTTYSCALGGGHGPRGGGAPHPLLAL